MEIGNTSLETGAKAILAAIWQPTWQTVHVSEGFLGFGTMIEAIFWKKT